MSTVIMPGRLNDHATAIVLKELVRRAIVKIRTMRFSFEAQQKPSLTSDADYVTDADKLAQAIYVKSLDECFPGFGIVAEEDGLKRPCTLPIDNAFFTVDPLDGTKAFIRGQSHGVGTMISLTVNGKIVCAYVGDVNTGEIYGYRAGSDKVFRITPQESAQQLTIDPVRKLATQYLLLRDPVGKHSKAVQKLVNGKDFKCHEIGGGSIGISLARLWKGEVGAAILLPRNETPWDRNPVVGISERMGFLFLSINPKKKEFEEIRMEPLKETAAFKTETLIIHVSRLAEVVRMFGPDWKLIS
jgi:fructose-1,6-bisphosphatase/inositol monophosphatase family enzyme